MFFPTIILYIEFTIWLRFEDKEDRTIISYNPMWDTMKKRGVSQYKLLNSGIDNKTLDSIKKGKNITLSTLEKLCVIIGCTPNEIVEFIEK